MGLTGIRDLSLIDTPPAERQPILTYVGEYDERAVAEAIRRELLREGQVFFVHNRVQDIERVAGELRDLVPEARVAVAHGQMDEGSLEQVVLDFCEGRYDVLVCTTIIESGIDMPTVNTLVVDRADLLGLGQLHQLRGRVGRAGQPRLRLPASIPRDRVLSEQAYERLRTIGEHTELGSGFKIAMRDLEIRGAGNLLGNDQSGHIAAVGYDLYVRMVAEAVAELKGEAIREPAEIKLDLADRRPPAAGLRGARGPPPRGLPPPGRGPRRRPRSPTSRAEWLDRYGPLPAPAEALLAVGRLRAECVRTGVDEVTAAIARPGRGRPRPAGRGGRPDLADQPQGLGWRAARAALRPAAVTKDDTGQLIVPLAAGPDLADRARRPPRRARAARGRRPGGDARGGRRRRGRRGRCARGRGGARGRPGIGPRRPTRRQASRRGGWPAAPRRPYHRHTVKRFAPVLVACLLGGLVSAGLAGCNTHLLSYAALVNGTSVSQSTLDSSLSAVASNKLYRCQIGAGPGGSVRIEGAGTTPTTRPSARTSCRSSSRTRPSTRRSSSSACPCPRP